MSAPDDADRSFRDRDQRPAGGRALTLGIVCASCLYSVGYTLTVAGVESLEEAAWVGVVVLGLIGYGLLRLLLEYPVFDLFAAPFRDLREMVERRGRKPLARPVPGDPDGRLDPAEPAITSTPPDPASSAASSSSGDPS